MWCAYSSQFFFKFLSLNLREGPRPNAPPHLAIGPYRVYSTSATHFRIPSTCGSMWNLQRIAIPSPHTSRWQRLLREWRLVGRVFCLSIGAHMTIKPTSVDNTSLSNCLGRLYGHLLQLVLPPVNPTVLTATDPLAANTFRSSSPYYSTVALALPISVVASRVV